MSKSSKDYEEYYEKLQILKKFKNNMGLFGKFCFPTALKRDIPPFHTEVYKTIINEKNRRCLIAAPRGTAKSTVCSLILPLYKAAFKKDEIGRAHV